MKCKNLLMLFLIIAIPATLMGGHLRAYFDEFGTITEFTTEDPIVEVYVIIFVEAVVQGVAYELELSSDNLELISATYPPGAVLGDPMNGVELAMSEWYYGLWGNPVLVTTLSFLNHNNSPTYLTTTNHENYETIVYSGSTGVLFPLSSRTSVFGTPVANADMSWGAVKNLYR